MAETADVVIAGGGPVGSALALALRDSGLNTVLLEARTADSSDARPLALSYGSRLILERLGAWPALEATATPISHIHVSQRGGFGRVGLDAAEAGFPHLGYVIDYRRLAQALAAQAAPVSSRSGARVTAWGGGARGWLEYELDGERHELEASLIVIADGGDASQLPDTRVTNYQQCAVTARVVSERPHNNIAYERFTSQGPLALLPDGDGWALVWTTTPERAPLLCAAEDEEFLRQLHAEFGSRVGAFTAVSARREYPLRLRRSPLTPADHIVLIGNAAQTLHPVAGQGFNLGLRDAWELAAHIASSHLAAPGTREWLNAYQSRRRLDREAGIGFTHALVQMFSNELMPLRIVRGTGLALLGCMPPLKNQLIRRMMFGARG